MNSPNPPQSPFSEGGLRGIYLVTKAVINKATFSVIPACRESFLRKILDKPE